VAWANLWRLATAYRDHGHRKANLDPLGMWQCESPPELSLASYGLEGKENELFRTEGIVFGFPRPEAPLSEIVQHLEQAYCRTMTLEVAQVEVSPVGKYCHDSLKELILIYSSCCKEHLPYHSEKVVTMFTEYISFLMLLLLVLNM